jgi:rubredoxin
MKTRISNDNEGKMISKLFRRIVAEIHIKTGRSVQEVFQDAVASIRGKASFAKPCICVLCGSKETSVTSTKTDTKIVIRQHKCLFCGWPFSSEERASDQQSEPEEKKSVLNTENQTQTIAKEKKKPHIKRRSG